MINEFRKVAGYKINIEKSGVFLYSNNEISEREIKKKTFETPSKKKKKHLGIIQPQSEKLTCSEL